MSVQEKIARLSAFIRQNPALANIPFMTVAGRPVSPAEALAMLQSGQNIHEIVMGLSRLGIDPDWELVEEFYKRLAAARPDVKIYGLGLPPMSPAEALQHIRARDEIGRQLLEMYSRMLAYMRERMGVL
jgi:CheY-like chemotaxis protein